jgi:flagellar biogenesis protein FliO
MFRVLTLSALLCLSTAVLAESMDEVLKSKSGVSEEQLDEAAAKMVKEDSTTPASASSSEASKASGLPPAGASIEKAAEPARTPASGKNIPEDQIPVLKNIKSSQSSPAGNWYRLIGSAIFVLAVTGGLIVVVKKSAKAKNVGGKKAKIEVLHQHFLGPKKSVALIQVAGEAILIGVTDHTINMIKPVALIDDEVPAETQDFNGFLEDDFTVEQLTAQKSRTRTV